MLSVVLTSYAYAEHTLTNCTHTLSIRIRFVSVCSAYEYHPYKMRCVFSYAYAEHTQMILWRMLSIRLQFVSVCSVYVYKLYAYARHTSIFEKMEYRGRKREFEKILFHMECSNNGNKLGSKISCLGTFKCSETNLKLIE